MSTKQELKKMVESNLKMYFTQVDYYRKDRTTFHTTRYDIGKAMSRKTKKEFEDIIKNAKNNNYQQKMVKKYMTI